MPISVKCPDCGKALKAPDVLAGQKAKCPDCGAIVKVPSAAWSDDPPTNSPVQQHALGNDDSDASGEETDKRRPCPMCGELIAPTAVECRFCGEALDLSARQRARQKTSASLDDDLTAADIALCILCFPVGCVVGIIGLIRGQSLRGLKMIGLAILIPFVIGAIRALLQ